MQPRSRRLVTEATLDAQVSDSLSKDPVLQDAAAAAVQDAVDDQGGITDPIIASAVGNAGSATHGALRGGFLPQQLTDPIDIELIDSTTTFHRNGITMRGPVIPNEDDTGPVDRGSRLTIHSSHGASSLNQRGEGIRLMVDTDQSKNMIAWYDNFTTPGSPRAKAWIGYHYGTAPDIVHDHISIETPDSSGGLYSRFGISTQNADVANVDFAMADVQVSASQGGAFRIAANADAQEVHPRDIIFATGTDHLYTRRRWALRADTDAESGSNAGSNFRLVRYDDSGAITGNVLIASRATGAVGFNTLPGQAQVSVTGTAQAMSLTATASVAGQGLLRLVASSTSGTALDARVPADTQTRFALSVAGEIEWGPGNAARDTFLRRSVILGALPVLRTPNDLYFDTSGRGPILRSPDGSLWRVSINDAGTLTTAKI